MDEYLSSEGPSKKICSNCWEQQLFGSVGYRLYHTSVVKILLAKRLFLNRLCTCSLYGGTKTYVTLGGTIQVQWGELVVYLSSVGNCSQ